MNSDISAEELEQSHQVLLRNWLIFAVLLTFFAWYARGPLELVGSMLHLAERPEPYFIPRLAILLNGVAPLSAIVISLFFMLPGLTLALAASRGRSMVHFVLTGFALSMVLICGSAIFMHQYFGVILRGDEFFILVAGLSLFAMIYVRFRVRNANHIIAPDMTWASDAGWALFTGFAMLSIMSAKFYWENLSADGGGVLHFVRLFIHTDWPFWPPDAGPIKAAPGVTSFLFVLPGSWFQRMFGETDLATRLPFVLYISMLYVVVVGFIRLSREAAIRVIDHLLIAAALLIFAGAMTYNGGYHPYFADSPMPAARETMVVSLFLGFTYFVAANRMASALWVGVLAYLSLPTAGLWMLLTLVAFVLFWVPRDWPRMAKLFGILVICALIGVLGPVVIRALDMPVPGGEFNAKGIINRLRYVTFVEPQRALIWIVPVGILPAISMLFVWTHDRIARVLTVITLLFFLFFYFQGYRVLPHHFIPAMIPPLVIMWRNDFLQHEHWITASRLGIILGLVFAGFLSFPRVTDVHTFSREFARQIDLRGPQFDGSFQPVAGETFHAIFGRMFPHQYRDDTVAENYHGGPMVWLHYAGEPKPEDQQITYVLQPASDPAPEGAREADAENGYVLYIVDEEKHAENHAMTFPYEYSAEVFHLKRQEIFGRGESTGSRKVYDLVKIARGFGVPF